jgi:hypothetical protein
MFTTPVKICRVWRFISLLMLGAVMARASTIIYPVEAIDDFWQLPAEEFRQKYGGINVTGIGPSDEGWYVRYKHENLTCLFGPLADSELARKKKWELEAVRDAAIRNRASLASSKVDYVKFSYTGAFGRGGAGEGSGAGSGSARISKDGKSGPDGDLDDDGISNAKDDDMDGDGIGNGSDPDADGDGIPNEKDDYKFGSNPDGDGKGNLAKNGGQDGRGLRWCRQGWKVARQGWFLGQVRRSTRSIRCRWHGIAAGQFCAKSGFGQGEQDRGLHRTVEWSERSIWSAVRTEWQPSRSQWPECRSARRPAGAGRTARASRRRPRRRR